MAIVTLTTDDTYATAQAALDALNPGDVVQFTQGTAATFTASKPLVNRQSHVTFQGQAPGVPSITCGWNGSGPTFINSVDYGSISGATTHIGASLATGSGNSLRLQPSGTGAGWWNIGRVQGCTIEGLTAMSVSFFVEAPATGAGGFVWSVAGKRYSYEAITPFVGLSFQSGVAVLALQNAAGTTATISSVTALSAGVTAFIEFTWDGTNLYSFFNGTLAQTVPFTGTLTQPWFAESVLGSYIGQFPDESLQAGGPDANIDSFSLRNDCTHTTSYTAPTAKSTWAYPHTLVLCNTEDHIDQTIAVTDYQGIPSWVPFICVNGPAGAMGYVTIQNLGFIGSGTGAGGIFTQSCVHNTIKNVTLSGISNDYPIYIMFNSFFSVLENVTAVASNPIPRAVLVMNTQVGLSIVRDCFFQSGLNTVVTLGSGITFENTTVSPEVTNRVCYYFIDGSGGGPITMISSSADIEGSFPDLTSNIEIDGLRQLTITGGQLANNDGAIPVIIANGSFLNSTVSNSSILVQGVTLPNAPAAGIVQGNNTGGRVLFQGNSRNTTVGQLNWATGIPYTVI